MKKIEDYYKYLEQLKFQTENEQGLSPAFLQLLRSYGEERDFDIVPEVSLENGLRPDATIKNHLRLSIGYWEAKDLQDNLALEIDKKIRLGYPTDNIIFENTEDIVLIQNGKTIFNIKLSDKKNLDKLLNTFFDFEPPEIANFSKALEKFSEDVPKILQPIREKIKNENSKEFLNTFEEFFNLARIAISSNITKENIVEMLIQHILTKDIFMQIFHETDFHMENSISKTMNKLELALLGRGGRQKLLKPIKYYYSAIQTVFQQIDTLQEKQRFLIKLYEEFYKAYNPKGADKLGIVYTPLEIVDFMINSVDILLYKYFRKTLASEKVAILDPATGTGTFMTEIINFLPNQDLKRKYQNELFANEIAILPYYIANLNIEYIYFKKTGEYSEFENIAFGDTLKMYQKEIKSTTKGIQTFDFFEDDEFFENSQRIEKENKTDFTVIIGNPPYNANQQNENDNNKNEQYPILDRKIKETYVKKSSATNKANLYDMYLRFVRWATNRIGKSGIIAFVTNSNFIDAKALDGFRKTVFEEFTEIYVVDLGGNVRKGDKDENVFNIMVGVAIMFLVKRDSKDDCKLWYLKNPEIKKADKLKWLKENKTYLNDLNWKMIIPDQKGNWLNQTNNDWDELLPLGTKECKLGKIENAIFKLFSNGVVTARDEWVYDFDKTQLEKKVKYFITEYNKFVELWEKSDKSENIHDFIYSRNKTIKFTLFLERDVKSGKQLSFFKKNIYKSIYRPFIKKYTYFSKIITHSPYQQPKIFPKNNSENIVIGFDGRTLGILGAKYITDIHAVGDFQNFPFYYYLENGEKKENITDFALKKFVEKYGQVSKKDIFNYIYAVLHFPEYRKKYEINLKQDLPRIPFYDDFYKFAEVGKKLLDLHVNFENVQEYEINFEEMNFGEIEYSDFKSKSFLNFFPKKAFEYKLGNRSAIEWVIDGYKEKKIKDPVVREKFGKYNFPKNEVLSLLKKVTTVSLETLKLIESLEKK